jgi:hypothetical protein
MNATLRATMKQTGLACLATACRAASTSYARAGTMQMSNGWAFTVT